jgi:hypothetical protein
MKICGDCKHWQMVQDRGDWQYGACQAVKRDPWRPERRTIACAYFQGRDEPKDRSEDGQPGAEDTRPLTL